MNGEKDKSTTNSVLTILFYALCLTLPVFVPSWHGKILVVFGGVWLYLASGTLIIQQVTANRQFQLIITAVSISLFGLLLSANLRSGLAAIESIVPLVILPLIIFSSDKIINNKTIRYALICFVAGVITLNLASLAFISYDLWDYKNLQSNIILANNSIVKIHPAFVSLYLSFCIFFLIDQYFPFQTANRSKLGWVLFSLVILVAYLIWINSRTGILSFSVAFIFYSLYRFRSRARIVSLSMLALFFITIYSVPFSRDRFFKAPRQAFVDATSNDPNVYPLIARKQILDCSLELMKGPEFFFGYGTGDFRDVLRDCFKEKNYLSLYEKGLDSHNEYFAQLHRYGIVGLIIFAALLIVPFRYALKYRSPLLAVFVILFAITALFENVFSAQKGVTFFALFCPLLMLHARKKYESYPTAQEAV